MVKSFAEEGDDGAAFGIDVHILALASLVQVQAQGAAILLPPIFVEIEDAGDESVPGAAELVQVPLVERPGGIDGQMTLELEQAQNQGLVDAAAKLLEYVEIVLLGRRELRGVKPSDVVATDFGVNLPGAADTDTGPAEGAVLPQGTAFGREPRQGPRAEETGTGDPARSRQGVGDAGAGLFAGFRDVMHDCVTQPQLSKRRRLGEIPCAWFVTTVRTDQVCTRGPVDIEGRRTTRDIDTTNLTENAMKFVCLGYLDETKWGAMTDSERNATVDECFSYDDVLRSNGHFAGGEALQPAGNARTLKWKEDKVVVTDGPYAETKEVLGGILMLEADSLDHAVELMSKHPGVRIGPFEIRPAADLSEMIRESERRRAG